MVNILRFDLLLSGGIFDILEIQVQNRSYAVSWQNDFILGIPARLTELLLNSKAPLSVLSILPVGNRLVACSHSAESVSVVCADHLGQ